MSSERLQTVGSHARSLTASDACPTRWTRVRLKYVVRDVNRQVSDWAANELQVALEDVEGWTGRLRRRRDVPVFGGIAKRFSPDDVLFGRLRPYLAKVIRPAVSGVCVGEFLVLRATAPALVPSYLERFLRCKPTIDAVTALTFGARMPRADWRFIGATPICLPPLPEQTAIVRFLDYADRRIRRYIRAKQKLIKLLEEQKQAIIHHAVTRGLDPNVRLKASGVEWLGEVPESWQIAALRHRYSQHLGKMLDSKQQTGRAPLRYLRNTDVQWDRVNTENLPAMDIHPEEYDRYTVRPGDLLVCEGGEVGRCALWYGDAGPIGFQKAIHRLRPLNPGVDDPRFLYYVLRAAASAGAFADGHVSTIQHLTGDKLRAQRFAFPPIDEQRAILAVLDARNSCIDNAAGATRREISLIREYRTCLIADVVTGKLDIREAAARLPGEAEDLAEPDKPEEQLDPDETDVEEVDPALAEAEA